MYVCVYIYIYIYIYMIKLARRMRRAKVFGAFMRHLTVRRTRSLMGHSLVLEVTCLLLLFMFFVILLRHHFLTFVIFPREILCLQTCAAPRLARFLLCARGREVTVGRELEHSTLRDESRLESNPRNSPCLLHESSVFWWHCLSNAACLMRPHLFYSLFILSTITINCYIIHNFWFPRITA